MKLLKQLLTALGVIAISLSSCGQNKKATENNMNNQDNKAIVCYFSATGTTERAAKRIAEIAGADIYEIVPAERYNAADLDWTDNNSRCYVEMHDPSSRPALKDSTIDLSGYEVVYLGYPNWWNTHPTIINSFIEANDLQGKIIVPFMTSGGSTIANSEKELKKQYPALSFGKGLLMNSKSDQEIQTWTDQFKN